MKKEKKEEPSFFKELGVFMNPYKLKYALSIIISVLSVFASIISYFLVGLIATNLFSDANLKKILLYLVLAVISKLLSAVLLNISTWISHKAAYATLKDIRLALSSKMLKLPLGYFEEKGSGRLKTLLVDHIESMEKTLAHMLPELTANLLGPLVCIIAMFIIDYRLALACLIWIILGFSVTGGMMKGYEEKFSGQIKVHKAMNQAIVEYVNGIEVIKNFGRTDEIYSKYKDACYDHANYNINWQKQTLNWTSLGMAIAPFSLFPILIFGLYFYQKQTILPETIFMMVILTFAIFTPLMNTMNYFDQLASMGVNAKEIKDVLDYPELKRGLEVMPSHFDLEFKNVSFKYDSKLENALTNINFKLPEAKMLALVGPSGAGKSTIAKILAGYFDPSSGEILIDGKNLTSYSQEELNKMIAYVDQETYLFDDTIMNNIRLAKPSASDAEVIRVAKATGIDEFITKLPNSYKTMVGEAGGKLSGGERQRIAIARAMMKDAPIIILDEATASSDKENEASIQKALSATTANKTLIVVAHRLETITSADQILYIENGEIKASGTHQELLNFSPYKKMWELGGER